MNKKLLVVAVAGALAVPGVAMAQVTISGKVGALWQSMSFSGATVGATRAGGKTSVDHISDNSSTLTFAMREDLGGGMAAYGRIEFRPTIEGGNGAGIGGSSTPPMWIGLESTSWGNMRVGTLSGLHYVTGPDYTGITGTPYNSVQVITGGFATPGIGSTYAMGTRVRNAIAWDSLSYGGFKMTVAYSTQAGTDNDLGSTIRKGRLWNFIPQFIQPNWNVGYSYYDNKPDAGASTNATAAAAVAAAIVDEKASRLFGEYDLRNGFKLGASWDSYKRTAAVGGVRITDRRAYSLQGLYVTGPHQAAVTYAKASNDKILGANTGANHLGVSYQYSLSKRTNVFATYQRVTNQAAAGYYAGGMQTPAYSGSVGMTALAGEDFRVIQAGMNHSF